ncbi:MAG: thiamine phosphate synthase [Thermoanaerobaculia bacterium]
MKLLYVTDRAAIGDSAFARILDALAGAPGLSVQLREKLTPDHDVLEQARWARERLGPDVALYVNRRFDVALAARAAGVHLPADGLPVTRVRSETPRGFRIGVSAHAPEQARDAIAAGADLVVLGPIFDTPSKRAFGAPLGPGALASLPRLEEHASEVYVIGGIDEERLPALEQYADRISGIAAVRLFQESSDPRAVAGRIVER